MSISEQQPRRSYTRRAVGLALCFSPLVLLLCSVAVALVGSERRPFAAIGFIVGALFFACLNFYLSFIRPWWLRRRRGSLDGVPHVTGLPIIGTILILLGGVLGFGAMGTALLGLVALTLDTGGGPWFLIATWCDSSVWDSSK